MHCAYLGLSYYRKQNFHLSMGVAAMQVAVQLM